VACTLSFVVGSLPLMSHCFHVCFAQRAAGIAALPHWVLQFVGCSLVVCVWHMVLPSFQGSATYHCQRQALCSHRQLSMQLVIGQFSFMQGLCSQALSCALSLAKGSPVRRAACSYQCCTSVAARPAGCFTGSGLQCFSGVCSVSMLCCRMAADLCLCRALICDVVAY
jgi:hypothetical protein